MSHLLAALTLVVIFAGIWASNVLGFDYPLGSIVITAILALATVYKMWFMHAAFGIAFAVIWTADALGVSHLLGFAPAALLAMLGIIYLLRHAAETLLVIFIALVSRAMRNA